MTQVWFTHLSLRVNLIGILTSQMMSCMYKHANPTVGKVRLRGCGKVCVYQEHQRVTENEVSVLRYPKCKYKIQGYPLLKNRCLRQ